jgi:hypothetical protein
VNAKLKQPHSNFPQAVPVVTPGEIGHGKFDSSTGSPCCAIGWRQKVFGDAAIFQWHEAYVACARVAGKGQKLITDINDSCAGDNAKYMRSLLFNAANAAIGYTEGQDLDAVRLARKAGFAC